MALEKEKKDKKDVRTRSLRIWVLYTVLSFLFCFLWAFTWSSGTAPGVGYASCDAWTSEWFLENSMAGYFICLIFFPVMQIVWIVYALIIKRIKKQVQLVPVIFISMLMVVIICWVWESPSMRENAPAPQPWELNLEQDGRPDRESGLEY